MRWLTREMPLAAPGSPRPHGRTVEAPDPLEVGRRLDSTRVKSVQRRHAARHPAVIEHLCDTENPLLTDRAREADRRGVDETLAFGPLEILLKDPTVSDIW